MASNQILLVMIIGRWSCREANDYDYCFIVIC